MKRRVTEAMDAMNVQEGAALEQDLQIFKGYNHIQQELHIKSPLAINPEVEENACGCGGGKEGRGRG